MPALRLHTLAAAVAASLAASFTAFAQAPAIDADDIGGTVTSANGPEAGVWVIAETNAFPTRFAKIVVTDDRGRYVVPDLPAAEYQLWVRGYGLADSAKVTASPGKAVDLKATVAPDAATAAKVYPAIYWYSMQKVPSASEVANLPGGVNQYLASIKNLSCIGCHQIGQLATRTIPQEFGHGMEGWVRRIQSGQAGSQMLGSAMNQLGGVPPKYLGDWTDRVAAGELPHAQPPRPKGVERNVVATVRDWATDKAYMHDLSGTDKRNPTVNAYGKLYGSPELSTDDFPILDPKTNTATSHHAPVRDADTPTTKSTPPSMPSHYWGAEAIWDSKANSHNPMLDETGRVWYTAVVRAPQNEPAFCKAGSNHPSAKLFPLNNSGRQISVYDPKSGKYTFVDTCYSTHHLQFDKNNVLWTSGGGPVVGWLDRKVFDATGDAEKAQGWTALILDTNGNGKRDEGYTEPGQPIDPAKDARVNAAFYAVMPNPADGSIWGATYGYPGSVVRVVLGNNPPATAIAEVFNVPAPGYGSRGADIDSNGVVWVSLGSGHLGSFDRRKCKGQLNGPKATGDQCPEGWSFFRYPGPGFVGRPEESAESSYYSWVDQHNTSGLGENTPMSTANLNDGVNALVNGEFVTLRIPYPLGFYSKGFEGRIDDANAGWKGRGLWVPSGDRTPWLKEGGKGTKPLVVHFQVRPNPLAK
ncbi:MAG TPA: carboxypeptidase regulatory-like domain-containing protein [Gammaproteobacteria bacterium]|nr:carboxypeptidase regulatory-like domain-containing protein [Gammaproteobacteria bacterium]